MKREQLGFNLIELMIVVAIIGIVASIAIPAYETYTIRAQVSTGLPVATLMKTAVIEAFFNEGKPPANRTDAGLTPLPDDTQGKYVSGADINNGVIVLTYGNEANARIQNKTLTLTPYESPEEFTVAWRCGNAAIPGNPPFPILGTQALLPATYIAPTIDPELLPASCRP